MFRWVQAHRHRCLGFSFRVPRSLCVSSMLPEAPPLPRWGPRCPCCGVCLTVCRLLVGVCVQLVVGEVHVLGAACRCGVSLCVGLRGWAGFASLYVPCWASCACVHLSDLLTTAFLFHTVLQPQIRGCSTSGCLGGVQYQPV